MISVSYQTVTDINNNNNNNKVIYTTQIRQGCKYAFSRQF